VIVPILIVLFWFYVTIAAPGFPQDAILTFLVTTLPIVSLPALGIIDARDTRILPAVSTLTFVIVVVIAMLNEAGFPYFALEPPESYIWVYIALFVGVGIFLIGSPIYIVCNRWDTAVSADLVQKTADYLNTYQRPNE
jgi:hypothetical protein